MLRGLRTNYLLNVGGMALPLACAFITVPIYIHLIGAPRYGILSLVWILLGYFGFLDFGLSRASANALSRLGHAGNAERIPVLVTSLYLNLALGIVGGVILFAASGLLLSLTHSIPDSLAPEIRGALPWIACMLPVALISAVGSGAIESRENFLASNILTTFGGVLGQVAPVVCAWLFGPSLEVVIPAAFLSRLLSTVLVWAVVVHYERPVDLRRFDRARVRELAGYGAWVSVTSIISPLLETLDQVLIGALLGPAAIAHYAVPMNVSTRSLVLSSALAKTLFPRLSRLSPHEAAHLARRAMTTLAYGFAAVCGPAIILAGPALTLWVGADFAAYATPVAEILMVGAWCNGIAYIPYTLLQGQGRPDITAKIHAAEIIPFMIVLYLLITHLGLPGAALAWTLRTGIDGIILGFASGQGSRALLRLLPPAVLVVACWAIATFSALPPLGALTVACGVGVLALAMALALDPQSRALSVSLLPAWLRSVLPPSALRRAP